MKKFRPMTCVVLAAGMLLALGSCEDNKTEGGGDTPPPTPDTTISKIEIKVSDLTAQSAKVTYTPSVDYLSYFPSIIEKSQFDLFADDAACIQDVLDFMKATANQQSKPLSEIINTYTKKGPQSNVFKQLAVGEEYVAYAVGLNSDGTVTSPLFTKNFTIPIPGPSGNKISVEITNIGSDGAIVKATTTNNDPYILDVWEASKLEGLTDEQIMDKVLTAYGENYWERESWRGDDMINVQGKLDPDLDYLVIAFGYEAGVKTTALVKTPFKTKPGGWVECTFTFEKIKLNSREATYDTTPSDNTVPYFYSLILASKIADGSNEAALAQLQVVIAERRKEGWGYDDLLIRGEGTQDFTELLPKTDYYLCAVGMTMKGEVITDLVKEKITTPDASTATVTFGTPRFSGREVTVSVTPGANTPRWRVTNIHTKYDIFTEDYMTTHMLEGVPTEGETTLTSKVPEDETKAYFYGLGFDASGNPGRLVHLEVPLP